MSPTFTGVHPLKFPVSDLPASVVRFVNPPLMTRAQGERPDGDD